LIPCRRWPILLLGCIIEREARPGSVLFDWLDAGRGMGIGGVGLAIHVFEVVGLEGVADLAGHWAVEAGAAG
jgi:hypothetical protein